MTRMLLSAPLLALALPAFSQMHAPPEMLSEEAALVAAYQEAGTPGLQHVELAKSAGDYTLSIRSWVQPGAAPSVETGTATRTMILDGRVMLETAQATLHGQPFTSHGMKGYDNVSGKWWNTWNDSMSTGLMVGEGSCYANHACIFTGSWNDPVTKGKLTARMESRWTSPHTEVFSMFGATPGGKEFKMMEIVYTRR